MLKATGINKSFGNLQILKDLSISVDKGEIVSIVGASGAGKTTLIQILSTLLKADSGEIEIDGTRVSEMDDDSISEFRNKKLGFVFQFHQLLPEFTAIENVMIPALIANEEEKLVRKRAMEILCKLGLEERAEHRPNELSGGEKQRVAVARALINNPLILFADEPTGSLDKENRDELQHLFFKLRNEYNLTIIIVTHDMTLAEGSDRVITLSR